MTLLTVSSLKQLPYRLQSLIYELQQVKAVSPEIAQHCLMSANICSHDIRPWQQFNHSAHQNYGSAIIYQGMSFDVVAMSWMPGDFSAIHARSCVSAVQSFGDAEYTQFHYDGDLLTTSSIGSFKSEMTRSLGIDQIYQMGNPSSKPFMSLHINTQSPRRRLAAETRVFDLYDAKIKCAENAFFCLSESEVQSNVPGLRADQLTTLRHHQHMLIRVLQMQQKLVNPLALQCVVKRLMAEIEFLRR